MAKKQSLAQSLVGGCVRSHEEGKVNLCMGWSSPGEIGAYGRIRNTDPRMSCMHGYPSPEISVYHDRKTEIMKRSHEKPMTDVSNI